MIRTRDKGPCGQPAAMRMCVPQCDASRTVTGVDVDREHYCSGILTAMLVEMPWWQAITFGPRLDSQHWLAVCGWKSRSSAGFADARHLDRGHRGQPGCAANVRPKRPRATKRA